MTGEIHTILVNDRVTLSGSSYRGTAQGVMHEFDPVVALTIRVTILSNSAHPGLHLLEVRAFLDEH